MGLLYTEKISLAYLIDNNWVGNKLSATSLSSIKATLTQKSLERIIHTYSHSKLV